MSIRPSGSRDSSSYLTRRFQQGTNKYNLTGMFYLDCVVSSFSPGAAAALQWYHDGLLNMWFIEINFWGVQYPNILQVIL